MSALLAVDGLTLRFPASMPVRDLAFSIDPGATLAIVGESGSGKSLTALALLGLLPQGARVAARAMRDIRGREIAMIFQEPMTSLNPVLTVGRQITGMIRRHQDVSRGAARARAIELLDLVRIPEPRQRVDDYPHHLSGGMRQRGMIAMAVACRPKLLIADEPTTALDVTIQAQILELLDRLRRELGMALVLITHDLGVVSQWADRVLVMYAGRKVEEALPGALFAGPLHPYTQGLLAASPRLDPELTYRDGPLMEIRGSIASAAEAPGCPFAPRCPIVRESCGDAVPPLLRPAPDRSVACPFTGAEA